MVTLVGLLVYGHLSWLGLGWAVVFCCLLVVCSLLGGYLCMVTFHTVEHVFSVFSVCVYLFWGEL